MPDMRLWCGDDRELGMVCIPPGRVVVKGSGKADPVLCSFARDFWISELPITVDQWCSAMQEDCARFDDGPGFATDMPWVSAREFCRVLDQENKDRVPDGYAVNLPTQAQWERSFDWMCRHGELTQATGHQVLFDGSDLTLCRPRRDASPLGFVLGLDEMCLDGPLDQRGACVLECIGPLQPHIRSVRAVQRVTGGYSLEMYRGYCGPGYGRLKWGGPKTGFRVAIHWQATGVAAARSPRIVQCTWGRTIVEGRGEYKDVKLYPGGGREWDWPEAQTHHVPGVGIEDAVELIEWGARHVVIGRGFHEKLQVTDELTNWVAERGVALQAMNTAEAVDVYNLLVAEDVPVGGLIHSTC